MGDKTKQSKNQANKEEKRKETQKWKALLQNASQGGPLPCIHMCTCTCLCRWVHVCTHTHEQCWVDISEGRVPAAQADDLSLGPQSSHLKVMHSSACLQPQGAPQNRWEVDRIA